MGVPGYFQWVSRRYPWVVKKIKPNSQRRHVDCLYIDVNAICYAYVKDETNFNYLLNPTEIDLIFKQILDHLEALIELMQPALQIYLMLDGPCPRAKINQQRQRRIAAQKSNEQLKAQLTSHGLEVKKETVPLNSISPGTPFMVELNKQIRSHFAARIATSTPIVEETTATTSIEEESSSSSSSPQDEEQKVNSETATAALKQQPAATYSNSSPRVDYTKVQVIISDSNAAGEGEHKILEIIRKHTNNQLTHCLVGADADLILLTLATPGKRIIILRENNRSRFDKDQVLEQLIAKSKAVAEAELTVGEAASSLAQTVPSEQAVTIPEGVEASKAQAAARKEYEVIDINAIKRIVLQRIRPLFDSKSVKHLKYNAVQIMDDYVFLSLFAGNDFLPRQHHMRLQFQKGHQHILDVLVEKYIKYLEDATSYLSNRGVVNFNEILNFFKELSVVETSRTDITEEFLTLPAADAITGLSASVDYVRMLNPHLSEGQLAELMLRDDTVIIPEQKWENVLPLGESDEGSPALAAGGEEGAPQIAAGRAPRKESGPLDKGRPWKGREVIKAEGSTVIPPSDSATATVVASTVQGNSIEESVASPATASQTHGSHPQYPKKKPFEMVFEVPEGRTSYLKTRVQVKTQGEYDRLIMKYLEGFQFTMMYYIRGIKQSSWNYFFPQYYAPLVVDIVDFLQRNPNFTVKFPATTPFQPFKQLLAILHPENAREILPESFGRAFQANLLEYCPEKYEVDAYGATADHNMIMKLPFIELETLNRVYEEALRELERDGSQEELERNQFTEDVVLSFDEASSSGDHIEVRNKLMWKEGNIENAKIKRKIFSNLDTVIPNLITDLIVDKPEKKIANNKITLASELVKHKQEESAKEGQHEVKVDETEADDSEKEPKEKHASSE